jgi:hypothetical protein
MSNPSQILISQLVDDIKVEARVKGSDNLDAWILNLVNQLLLDYCEKNQYFELLVTNSVIATLQSTEDYTLPTDFGRERLIRYLPTNGTSRTLKKRNQFLENPRGQFPRWYEVNGTVLSIFPVDNMPAGDSILIDFWKLPTTVVLTDTFPIPRLLPSLRLRAVTRVLAYNNAMPQAGYLKGEAQESESRAR